MGSGNMRYQLTAHREAEVEKLGNIEPNNVFRVMKASLQDPTVNYVRVCLSPELPTEERVVGRGERTEDTQPASTTSPPHELEENEATEDTPE